MLRNNMKNAIRIKLKKEEIDAVFRKRNKKKWDRLLDDYLFLQENLDRADAPGTSAQYQKKFNSFYQVRRNAGWRKKFYALFFLHAKKGKTDFAAVLNELHKRTGQVEASFASKFVATIDPGLPVIDQRVLTYIDRRLPPSQREPKDRISAIIELHGDMRKEFAAFLKNTTVGKHLIKRFTEEYGDKKISPMKMLDFVLWQSGGKKKKNI